jgi:hypothetical protein
MESMMNIPQLVKTLSFSGNFSADFLSRFLEIQKSIVAPSESTALYRYDHCDLNISFINPPGVIGWV